MKADKTQDTFISGRRVLPTLSVLGKPALNTGRLSLLRLLVTMMQESQVCSLCKIEMSYLNSKNLVLSKSRLIQKRDISVTTRRFRLTHINKSGDWGKAKKAYRVPWLSQYYYLIFTLATKFSQKAQTTKSPNSLLVWISIAQTHVPTLCFLKEQQLRYRAFENWFLIPDSY